MTSFQLHIYLCEVELQCEFSLAAAKSVNAYFSDLRERAAAGPERLAEPDPEMAQAQLFRSIHSFLTHAALVSRLIWPSRPKQRRAEDSASYDRRLAQAENRGKQVRAALRIADKQPTDLRTLRNHLEHFDERLDNWVLAGERSTFVDRGLGPPNRMFGLQRVDTMRWFDQIDGSFHFRGERFDLRALAALTQEIHGLAADARRYGPTSPSAV